jgi:hypothetical protein
MKTNIKYSMKKYNISLTLLFLLLWGFSWAQETTKAVEKRESAVQLSFYKKADQTKTARVKVTAKNEHNKYMPVANAHVNVYALNNKAEELIGSGVTPVDGQVVIDLPKTLPLDADLKFTLIAKLENDLAFEDAKDQGSFREANLTVIVNPADTTRTVTVKATQTDKDGKEKPIANATINFYVQRFFGTMPAAEDKSATTDETGTGTFTLPRDIKGDTAGNIVIVAKIEDNDTYGNIDSKVAAPMGIQLAVDKNPFPRALWEPRAPAPLVITISIIFTCIWCIYFTLFYTIIKMSRDKNPPTPTGKPPYGLAYEEWVKE